MTQSDNERRQQGKQKALTETIHGHWPALSEYRLQTWYRVKEPEYALSMCYIMSTCMKFRNRETNLCCSHQDGGNCWSRGTPGAPEEGCRMLGAQVCLQCMLTELHTSQLFSACASPDVTQKEINAGDTCRSKCHWYVLEKQAWGCRSKHASHSCHRTWMSTFLLLPLSTKCSCWLWNVSAWVIHYQTWRWTAYTCVYLLAPQLACGLAADTR